MLNLQSKRIAEARELHVEELTKLLSVKSKKLSPSVKKVWENKINPILNKLLGGRPIVLKRQSDELQLNTRERKVVSQMLNYDWFSRKKKMYNAYTLASNLGVNTCAYCNRNYTITVPGTTRAFFDHYFPKKKYPLLALSFYNLVPSCSICNSTIKGGKELSLKKHVHPYKNNYLDDFWFSYDYNEDQNSKLKVKIKYKANKSKTRRTLDFFKLEDVYNAHTDELKDLLKVRTAFSDKYLEILSSKILKGTKIGKDELYQLAFGVYLEDSKILNRPLSKFKRDILTELGIIKLSGSFSKH